MHHLELALDVVSLLRYEGRDPSALDERNLARAQRGHVPVIRGR